MNRENEIMAMMGLLLTTSATAAGALLALDDDNKSKKKREWVKKWKSRREMKGSYKLINQELRLEDKSAYRRYLRMDENCFNILLELVSSRLKRHNTLMRDSIPVDEKLSTTLRFLATGESYRSMEYSTRVSLSSLSAMIPDICSIIYEELQKEYLAFPETKEEWKKIADDFTLRWQFPLCIGALDGKHVAFRASKKDGSLYYNYKGFHSIILLGLCDADYKFIYINVGCNGRNHDSGVLHISDLRTILNDACMYLPEDSVVGNNRKLPFVIVGDDAFPLEKHIMKPYPYNSQSNRKIIFNKRLSRARQSIEHAFGMLSNRFRILQTKIHLRPEKVKKVVQACCVLHNFLIASNMPEPGAPVTDSNSLGSNSSNMRRQRNTERTGIGASVRDSFADYFVHEGRVPWQNDN